MSDIKERMRGMVSDLDEEMFRKPTVVDLTTRVMPRRPGESYPAWSSRLGVFLNAVGRRTRQAQHLAIAPPFAVAILMGLFYSDVLTWRTVTGLFLFGCACAWVAGRVVSAVMYTRARNGTWKDEGADG